MRPSFLPLQRLSSTALVAILALMATPALAQTAAPGTLQPMVAAPTEPPTYTLIHVNAHSGSDTSGDGSQLRPYQTITHALGVATVNSIVLLAAGEYSEASGERFPIQLRAGVTVQGSPNSGLGQTVILGSGIFASTTGGMVHATLVGADGAGLGYVTVTNTSTAGYGLVIETGRPAIRQNQFVGSGYGGVYVTGNSAPVLEGNQFSHNGVVGLVLEGQTAAEVRGNRFEQTGIGIRVAPGAQPQIINNTIVQNQEGLLLDGSANPILQDNVIAQNRRNGVVEFQVALKAEEPDLETAPMIPAPSSMAMAPPASFSAGPDLASAPMPTPSPIEVDPPAVVPASRVAAIEDTPPQMAPPTEAPSQSPAEVPRASIDHATIPSAEALPLARLTVEAAPDTATTSTVPAPATATSDIAPASAVLPTVSIPATPGSSEPAAPTANPAVVFPPTTSESAPASASISPTVTAARDSFRRWRQSRSGAAPSETAQAEATTETPVEAVSIAVIPPPVSTVAMASEPPSRPTAQLVVAQSSRPAAPAQVSAPVAASNPAPQPTNSNLLPVPSRTIPVGSGGSAIPNLPPPSTPIAFNGVSSNPPSYGGLLGLVYKVVVPAADSDTQAQVRTLVADAFRVNLDGQTMMQVGAYADEATAEARANELIAQGFEARVEYRP